VFFTDRIVVLVGGAKSFKVRTIVQFPRARGNPSAIDVTPDARIRTAAFVMKYRIPTALEFEVLKTFIVA
jgi:hypothetical protein